MGSIFNRDYVIEATSELLLVHGFASMSMDHALASLITSWLEGSPTLASIQKSASSMREE